jgi:acetyl-CoA C-acetyltransferase
MSTRVAIVGAGWSGFSPATPGISYKELMFAAAMSAYEDAGVDPRTEIDSFVCCSEDLEEGTSIFDEYVPDQLGAVQRPVHTVAGDGLFGLATAVMLIASGVASTVAVEAHSKASDVETPSRLVRFATDPIINRPLEVNALAIAGLEMRRYLYASGRTASECSLVAARNRQHAVGNERASFPADDEPVDPRPVALPLMSDHVAQSADGCVVLVLAAGERAGDRGVWVDGVGWSQDSPSLESRDWTQARYAQQAASQAYQRAGIGPADVEFAEVDDTFAFKQLQHLEALGLEALDPARVNPSGGALGEGYLHEANGLARVLACVETLRAQDSGIAVAQSWRGVPSSSGAVAVMRRG